jgi:hypothetical protein
MITSTTTVLKLANLFSVPNRDSVQEELEGRFEQTLIKTKGYEITLVTLVNHKDENDSISSGVHYEVYTTSDDKTHKFPLYEAVEAFVDNHMIETRELVKVYIQTNAIKDPSQINWKKDKATIGDLVILEIRDTVLKNEQMGFMKKSDVELSKDYEFLSFF